MSRLSNLYEYYGIDAEDLSDNFSYRTLLEHGETLSSSCDSNTFDNLRYRTLFEHRGKPDPIKVRERAEAHKRGLIREKNAEKRRKQEEAEAREREHQKARKQITDSDSKVSGTSIENSTGNSTENSSKAPLTPQRKQQLLDKVQQIKDKQAQKNQESNHNQKTQQSDDKGLLDNSGALRDPTPESGQSPESSSGSSSNSSIDSYGTIEDDKALTIAKDKHTQLTTQYRGTVKQLYKQAPSNQTKSAIKNTNTEINKTHTKYLSWLDKLTPANRKKAIQKMQDEYNQKLDTIKEREMKDLKTPEERKWYRKNFDKVKRATMNTVSDMSDLMGYKAIYDDIKSAAKFLTGR